MAVDSKRRRTRRTRASDDDEALEQDERRALQRERKPHAGDGPEPHSDRMRRLIDRIGAPDDRVAAPIDRMPPIPTAKMTNAQRKAARELAAGRRGKVVGPFIPALRSPELMSRLQRLGEYLRYENLIGPRLTEMAILLTAREWTQQFEWTMHVTIAEEQGLKRSLIDAIAQGRRPTRMAKDEAAVYDFFSELQRTKSISDPTYQRAVATLGEAGVIDLLGIIGYYTTLAMMLNVARTPLPPEKEPMLEPFPAV